MVFLSALLAWLAWQVLAQDRVLEAQQAQARAEAAADLIVARARETAEQTGTHLETLLAAPPAQLASQAEAMVRAMNEGGAIAVLEPAAISVFPAQRFQYLPAIAAPREADTVFREADLLEFQRQDHSRAIALLQPLARSSDPQVRAGALLRLARNQRRAGLLQEARRTYNEALRETGTAAGGVPAELMARYALCSLLVEMNRQAELQEVARNLRADLLAARWPLTRGAYEFYLAEVEQWASDAMSPDPARLAAAAALEWLYGHSLSLGDASADGLRIVSHGGQVALIRWRGSARRMVAAVATGDHLQHAWLLPMQQTAERHGTRVSLLDADGSLLLGSDLRGSRPIVRGPSETRLPWVLHVTPVAQGASPGILEGRRRLTLAGFGVLFAIVFAAAYFILRAVTRELEVARLQSDFVAAVSHEFRTPLASLLQMSELLADGRVSDARRPQYYELLRREATRLQRLVEGLLDFARMEASGREYRMESLDADGLVRSVVGDFQQEVTARGYSVEVSTNGASPRLHADPEALSRALWNLLENAVKYSPTHKTVWVEAGVQGDRYCIYVRDRGLGISREEQEKVFEKFVRASSAQAAAARGTGLGLAMVRHIVSAHGGQVRVESQPGEGSTFTVSLPVEKRS